MAGDAATKAAGKVNPSDEQLNQIDKPADDNTWHETPDLSKDNLKSQVNKYKPFGKKDLKDAATQGTATAHPQGSTDPADTAALAAQDQTEGTASGVNATGGLQAAAQTLNDRADTGDAVPKAKAKTQEYRDRTQNYIKGKMPKERREQTIWRLKKMVRCQYAVQRTLVILLGCRNPRPCRLYVFE
jgi:Family of unknown function (DUF5923)